MSAVCIIPARGGSRRIPRKNIKPFHGKPIIAYSIEAAKESGLFDEIWVSTDSAEIATVSVESGAMILVRSEKYAQDEIGTQEVMRDALLTLADARHNFDYACCIYPCAPMMTAEDLKETYYKMVRSHVPPFFYFVQGWFYWGRTQAFIDDESLSHGELPAPSGRWIDINTAADWFVAEEMYKALCKPAEQWTEEETREFMKGSQP